MKAVSAYALVTHTKFIEYDDQVDIDGVFIDFKDAVASLKDARLKAHDSWIPVINAITRDKYPFRNKIGELWSSEGHFIGWGYSWFALGGGGDFICSVFLQKTNIWQRSSETYNGQALSRKERQVLEAESDIDYVAGGKDMPEDARSDEKTLDLVFDDEEGDSDES